MSKWVRKNGYVIKHQARNVSVMVTAS